MRNAILVLLLSVAPTVVAQSYDVYAIRYATIPQFHVSSLVKGADESRTIDIAMMVWLVRGNGRNVLIDSGFHRQRFFETWKVDDFMRPDEAVRKAGVYADDITDLILTHSHWDHADGADLFPKAKIWIQKDEYAYYTGAAWQHGGQHGGIEPEDMLNLLRANVRGRLEFVDGNAEILPGIRVHVGGRHTWQSQYVSVETKNGPVVIASDNLYLYENLEKRVPIAQTFDEKSNLAAQEQMRKLVKDVRLIVPGHDPAVLTRFPKVAERVVRIE